MYMFSFTPWPLFSPGGCAAQVKCPVDWNPPHGTDEESFTPCSDFLSLSGDFFHYKDISRTSPGHWSNYLQKSASFEVIIKPPEENSWYWAILILSRLAMTACYTVSCRHRHRANNMPTFCHADRGTLKAYCQWSEAETQHTCHDKRFVFPQGFCTIWSGIIWPPLIA